jgi:hypothetical protein
VTDNGPYSIKETNTLDGKKGTYDENTCYSGTSRYAKFKSQSSLEGGVVAAYR